MSKGDTVMAAPEHAAGALVAWAHASLSAITATVTNVGASLDLLGERLADLADRTFTPKGLTIPANRHGRRKAASMLRASSKDK